MLHRILVNVVQSGEIRVPVGEFRFPEVMPNLAPRRIVPLIDPFGCLLMKQTDHRSQIVRVFIGGMCYEVVMIGKKQTKLQDASQIAALPKADRAEAH